MLEATVAIAFCLLLWGARGYLSWKYRIKCKFMGEVLWIWRSRTPDWITRLLPWLEFLGWVALAGLIVWWVLRCLTSTAFPIRFAFGYAE